MLNTTFGASSTVPGYPSCGNALVAFCADYGDLEPDPGLFQTVNGNGAAVI